MKDLLQKTKNVLDGIDTRVLPTGLVVAVENLKKEIADALEPRVQEPVKKVTKKAAKKKVAKKPAKKVAKRIVKKPAKKKRR